MFLAAYAVSNNRIGAGLQQAQLQSNLAHNLYIYPLPRLVFLNLENL